MNESLYVWEEWFRKQKNTQAVLIPYVKKPQTIEERNQIVLFYVPTLLKVVKSKFLNHPLYEFKHHIDIDDLLQEAILITIKVCEKFQQDYCLKSDFQAHLVYRLIVELKRLLLRHNRLTTPSHISRQRNGWKEEIEKIFYLDNLDESDSQDKKVIFSSESDNNNGNYLQEYYQEKIKQLIKSAKLSPLEEKLVKFRFGLDGKTLNNKEIGAITGLSSVSVSIFCERALRKLIAVNSQNWRSKRAEEIESEFSSELESILMCRLSEKERIILRAYYGFDRSKKTLNAIAWKTKVTKEQIRRILRKSRRKILESKDIRQFLSKTRGKIFSLIQSLELKPFHLDLLFKFYCLDGEFYLLNKEKYFSLWKAQQRFKASLPTLVGLVKFSRDMAMAAKKEDRKQTKADKQ